MSMTELPQYHFSRSDFVKVWEEVLDDRSDDVLELCVRHSSSNNFKLWVDEFEEWYIKHIPTGVIINWYKGWHLGRTKQEGRMTDAVYAGFALPKGHGDLIDRDKLPIEDLGIGDYSVWGVREYEINDAPAIIEADKGE